MTKHLLTRLCQVLFLFGVLLLLSTCPVFASAVSETESDPTNTFRWIHANTDTNLWEEILTAFNDELRPDDAKEGQSNLETYRYKYIQRIGVLGHSALVIIGRRPAKEINVENEWDEYHSAFNFDIQTKRKSSIGNAEVMWQWKFVKLAQFGPSPIPDVTYTYFTCTECEPDKMFASLYFNEVEGIWKIRSWGDGKDIWWTVSEGLVVDMDTAASDTLSFDCVYGIRDLEGKGFENLVMRCKAAGYEGTDALEIQDDTVVYGLVGGHFKRRLVKDPSEVAGLTAKVCRPSYTSLLCKLPAYLTVTSGQNAELDQWFQNFPKAKRDLASFRNLKKTMLMTDVARRCGKPDELGGSGIPIFVYHLDDGSLVAIGATGPTSPLLYANHIAASGKSSPLLPSD